MRVCLLSRLHCFPTPACPSCSLALILPVAALRLYGPLQRQQAHPHPRPPALPTPALAFPWWPLGWLLGTTLRPQVPRATPLTSGRIWG